MAGSEEVEAETDARPEEVEAETDAGVTAGETGTKSREVIVPLRLYKTVTVFSTLFAVVFVLAGFVLLDSATNRATAEFAEIDPVLGILGLGSLVFGAAIYAFSTRFRTEQMGKAKDDSAEESDNG
jgi:hypothetical protein